MFDSYVSREEAEVNDTLEFLEKKKEERLQKIADEYGFTLEEIREKYATDREEVYDMDDGDNFLQSVDTVIWVIS